MVAPKGFPILVIARASLDELNSRLPKPLPMERFRPNLVIDGVAPWVSGWGLTDVIHVAARTPDDDVVWLLVDAPSDGLRAEPLRCPEGGRRNACLDRGDRIVRRRGRLQRPGGLVSVHRAKLTRPCDYPGCH